MGIVHFMGAMRRNLLDGLLYLALSLCVLAGAADLLYFQFPDWALLAFTALVGAAAGGAVPRRLRAAQAWIALVALTWIGYFYILGAATSLGHVAWLFLPWPLAASVGVAAGLAAWRLPRRLGWWRPLPLVLGAAAVVGITFLGNSANSTYTPPAFHRYKAPAYTLHLMKGGTVESSSLGGKTVVLAFWATWCKPCREEMPGLQKLYVQDYRDNPKVAFYLVDLGIGGETKSKARAYLRKYGITIPTAFDHGGRLMDALNLPHELPTRVVIDAAGTVDYRSIGYGGYAKGFPNLRRAIAGARSSSAAD